jgi:small nuclear ribonucleoprotein (snRNP)-like protein
MQVYDSHLNLLLKGVKETHKIKDPESGDITKEEREFAMMYVRGDLVKLVSPLSDA